MNGGRTGEARNNLTVRTVAERRGSCREGSQSPLSPRYLCRMKKTHTITGAGIGDYITAERVKAKGKVKAAIVERWNTRIVPRGLDRMGAKGAQVYLESYGKGISASKVAELALCAESRGAGDMAEGFWAKAFFLREGVTESCVGLGVDGEGRGKADEGCSGLPSCIQPGLVHTMQAVDAVRGREAYVEDENYYGQPKRDGVRNVLFAAPDKCLHQSRSTSLMPSIGGGLEEAAMRVAGLKGSFVLDGERYYRSVNGQEHRTAAQAAAANLDVGRGEVQPTVVYGVFKALFADGVDLRGSTEEVRVGLGAKLGTMIAAVLDGEAAIEVLSTAKTRAEKEALVRKQRSERREGEVWTRRDCCYTGGKGHKTDSIRTKYVDEAVFTVASIAPSKTRAGGVGSIEVCDARGVCVGRVGSGFDEEISSQLVKLHNKSPGQVRVLIRHQGTTEQGKLWHARLLDLV